MDSMQDKSFLEKMPQLSYAGKIQILYNSRFILSFKCWINHHTIRKFAFISANIWKTMVLSITHSFFGKEVQLPKVTVRILQKNARHYSGNLQQWGKWLYYRRCFLFQVLETPVLIQTFLPSWIFTPGCFPLGLTNRQWIKITCLVKTLSAVIICLKPINFMLIQSLKKLRFKHVIWQEMQDGVSAGFMKQQRCFCRQLSLGLNQYIPGSIWHGFMICKNWTDRSNTVSKK